MSVVFVLARDRTSAASEPGVGLEGRAQAPSSKTTEIAPISAVAWTQRGISLNDCRRRSRASRRRDELEAIAPRVFGEEASGGFNLLIVASVHAGSHQALSQGSKRGFAGQAECGVCLLGGPKVALDSDVDLLAAALKPDPAAGRER